MINLGYWKCVLSVHKTLLVRSFCFFRTWQEVGYEESLRYDLR